MASLLIPTCESPSVPHSFIHSQPQVDEPGRIAAFVIELDILFDCERWQRARARAAARRIAAARGLDPLWSEVLALEMSISSGGSEALTTLGVLSTEPDLEANSFRDSLDAIEETPDARATLEALGRRFKLACVSLRPQAEVSRLLRALDMEHLFDRVTGGESYGEEQLRRVAERLEEHADACVLVTAPTSPALDMARRTGMQTVALALGDGLAVTALGNADLAVTAFSMIEKLGAGADSKY